MPPGDSRYELLAERFWNLPAKGEEEAKRERLFMDDIIQKAHLDREISRYLAGVETVFDGGAGTGRFSIPLAQRGLQVTHFDISHTMLAKARELAQAAGVGSRISFVHGSLTDLRQYGDNAFDLVISFDAPVSYTYPEHVQVLSELVRIARKAVIVSVSSRLGYASYNFSPLQKLQYIADDEADDALVRWYLADGHKQLETWAPDFAAAERLLGTGLPENPDDLLARMERGETPWPVNYCFLPEELASILDGAGLRNVKLSGPGALARSIPKEILRRLLLTPEYRRTFLDFCYVFDSQPSVCGLGKDNLVASGHK